MAQLKIYLKNDWSKSYFSVFGILEDKDLKEPEEIDFIFSLKIAK